MKTIAAVLSLLLALSPAAMAAAPQRVLYQGTLRRSGALFTGNATFVFRVTDANGGTQYWTSGSTVVAVNSGLFRYPLGITNTGADGGFPSVSWASIDPYVEVTVDGTVLSPREPMVSVPYALYNLNIANVNKYGDSMLGPLTMWASSITIVNQISTAAFSLAVTTATDRSVYHLYVATTGNVGIGTPAPAASLEVNGGASAGTVLLNSSPNLDGRLYFGPTGAFSTSIYGYRNAGSAGRMDFYVDNAIKFRVMPSAVAVGGPFTPLATFGVSGNAAFGSYSGMAAPTDGLIVSGNVGIGTTAPGARLEVKPEEANAYSLLVSSQNGNLLLGVDKAGDVYVGPHAHALSAGDLSTNPDLLVGGNIIVDGQFISHNGIGSSVTFTSNGDFIVGTSTLVVTQGRIGIGTTAPAEILDIVGNKAGDTRLDLRNSSSSGRAIVRQFSDTAGGGVILTGSTHAETQFQNRTQLWNNSSGVSIRSDAAGGNINFFTGGFATGDERMRIDNTGKVGIGTTPTHPVHLYSLSGSDNLFIEGAPGSDVGIVLKTGSTASILRMNNSGGTETSSFQDASGILYINNSSNAIRFVGAGGANLMSLISGGVVVGSPTSPNTSTGFQVGTSSLVVRVDGKVGIGMTAPQAGLHVSSNAFVDTFGTSAATRHVTIKSGGGQFNWGNYPGNWAPSLMLQGVTPGGAESAANFLFMSALDDTQPARLTTTKGLEVYTGAVVSPASAGNLALAFDSTGRASVGGAAAPASTRLWVQGAAADNFHLQVSSQNGTGSILVADRFGNVGIGTTAPTSVLDVSFSNATSVTAANIQSNSISGTYISNDIPTAGTDQGSVLMFDNIGGRSRAAIAAFTGDTNLDNSQLAFYTHTSIQDIQERMRIDTAGNVGIGTTGPTSRLHVSGGANPAIKVEGAETNDAYLYAVNNENSTGNGAVLIRSGSGADDVWALGVDNSDSGKLKIVNHGNLTEAPKMTFDSTGNVGIGTTAPSAPLHVVRPAGGTVSVFESNSDGFNILLKDAESSKQWGIYTLGNDLSIRETGVAERLFIQAGGNVGFGTDGPAAKIHLSSGSFLVDGNGGKIETASGGTLTTAACASGAGEAFVGNDMAGKITIGALGAAACTVTFATAYANAPICVASEQTTPAAIAVLPAAGSLVLNATFVAADIINYICIGRR